MLFDFVHFCSFLFDFEGWALVVFRFRPKGVHNVVTGGREIEDTKFEPRKCGLTSGLKSLRKREQNPNLKPFAKIAPDMERVVGKNANRFIRKCSKWVKAEWNLPTEADGINVAHALELQCKLLFRGWRYRLKEEHFTGKTIIQAISNKPLEHISEKNWANKSRQKIKPVNGAKSTARIYHDEEGADNLSLKEAYLLVMKQNPGYHRGLGPDPQLPRKEAALQGQVGELQTTNSKLKAKIERMKSKAIERDN
ncbi:hypothetical protein Cgig2_032919 [Carnegiea gigantea]|uniref:Uncharacterized protein n=1 Tax=Carnegiea gigantea TaxID=171969 RepID=A0A9Q1QAV1_9CARY|nr:hypothetical protein Cgig2_032919 [Carnegiea gigantea]